MHLSFNGLPFHPNSLENAQPYLLKLFFLSNNIVAVGYPYLLFNIKLTPQRTRTHHVHGQNCTGDTPINSWLLSSRPRWGMQISNFAANLLFIPLNHRPVRWLRPRITTSHTAAGCAKSRTKQPKLGYTVLQLSVGRDLMYHEFSLCNFISFACTEFIYLVLIWLLLRGCFAYYAHVVHHISIFKQLGV